MKKSNVFYWLVPPAIFFLNPVIEYFFMRPPLDHSSSVWEIFTTWPRVIMYRYHYPYPGLVYFALMGWLVWKWYKDPCFFWALCLFLVCLVCGPTGSILCIVGH